MEKQSDDRLTTIERAADKELLSLCVTVDAEPPTLRLPAVEPDLGRRDSTAGVELEGAGEWLSDELVDWCDEENGQ